MKRNFNLLAACLALAVNLPVNLPAADNAPYFNVSGVISNQTLSGTTNWAFVPAGAGRAAIDEVIITANTNGCLLSFWQPVAVWTIGLTNAPTNTVFTVGSSNTTWINKPVIIERGGQNLRGLISGFSTNAGGVGTPAAPTIATWVTIVTNHPVYATQGPVGTWAGDPPRPGDKVWVFDKKIDYPITLGLDTVTVQRTNSAGGPIACPVKLGAPFVSPASPLNALLVQLRNPGVSVAITAEVTNLIWAVNGRYLGVTPY